VTPSGIETVTIRLKAQYINQLRHRAQDNIKMDLILTSQKSTVYEFGNNKTKM
jgi:hypothetical protein